MRVSDFRVLFICTANYCRSPMAQQLLRTALDGRFGANGWVVESAGLDTPIPTGLHELAAAVLAERGTDVRPHTPVAVTAAMIGGADLILTATRRHRAAIVRVVPAAVGKTFTVKQFARYCSAASDVTGADAGALGRALVVEAKAARARLQPVPAEEDDLADPMGYPLAAFQVCGAELQSSIDAMLRPVRVARPG